MRYLHEIWCELLSQTTVQYSIPYVSGGFISTFELSDFSLALSKKQGEITSKQDSNASGQDMRPLVCQPQNADDEIRQPCHLILLRNH